MDDENYTLYTRFFVNSIQNHLQLPQIAAKAMVSCARTTTVGVARQCLADLEQDLFVGPHLAPPGDLVVVGVFAVHEALLVAPAPILVAVKLHVEEG